MAESQPVDVVARLLKLTPRRVQQLAKEGVIPRATRGRYELIPALQGYIDYLRDALERRSKEDGNAPDIRAEKARLAKEQADKLARENALQDGRLVDAEEMASTIVAVNTALRTRLSAVGVRWCHELAESTEPARCNEIVDEAIREALEEISALADLPHKPGGGG